ncbi:hypothetical protein RF11_09928 [Thelohanellus kitauei]|uniref:Uncharacterized protein n=1 Tax=Thelohanellus kitauei TaxID=669202 RepID=A0A0C2N2U5_THEKT|nr:hypothetical protein RF11_09928 [Thelohanellus kitauei]
MSQIFFLPIEELFRKYTRNMESEEIQDDKIGGPKSTQSNRRGPHHNSKEIQILPFEEFQLAITEKNAVKIHFETRNHPQTNENKTIQKTYDYSIVFYETSFKFIIRHLLMSHDTIYIDETGLNLHLRREEGRFLSEDELEHTTPMN